MLLTSQISDLRTMSGMDSEVIIFNKLLKRYAYSHAICAGLWQTSLMKPFLDYCSVLLTLPLPFKASSFALYLG